MRWPSFVRYWGRGAMVANFSAGSAHPSTTTFEDDGLQLFALNHYWMGTAARFFENRLSTIIRLNGHLTVI